MIFKFAGLVREFGFPNAILYAANRAIGAVFPRVHIHRYDIVAQPVPDGDRLPARRGRSIAVRPIAARDPVLAELPVDDSVLAFRYAQDVVCLGAFQDEQLIGCLWLCFGEYEEDEMRCIFDLHAAGNAAWDFDVYLHPEARLGFGFLRLWDEANALLRKRGVAWSVSRISAFNPGSLAAHARMGATRFGGLLSLTGPRRQIVFSSFPPRVSICRHDKRLPRYVLVPPAADDAR